MSDRASPRENPTLLGQEAAEAVFLSRWNSGRLPHAWLITGPAGIGKATLAFRIARFVLAEGQGTSGGPLAIPAEHPVFHRVASGGHSDLMVLSRETGERGDAPRTVIGVDEVRAAGRFLSLTAGESSWRVVVVDSADELNTNAANALLKILEEPPSKTLILLVSHVPGRLLATVRSRCCRLALGRLSEPVMRTLIEEVLPEVDPADREGLLTLAEGSIGRAVSLAQANGLDLFREVIGFAAGLPTLDVPALHGFGDRLARRDAEAAWRTAMQLWLWWIARIARSAAATMSADAVTPPSAAPLTLAGGEIVPGEAEVARTVIARAGLERVVEVWEKTAALIAQADSVNLDRKQVVIGAFHQLQTAMRG